MKGQPNIVVTSPSTDNYVYEYLFNAEDVTVLHGFAITFRNMMQPRETRDFLRAEVRLSLARKDGGDCNNSLYEMSIREGEDVVFDQHPIVVRRGDRLTFRSSQPGVGLRLL